jgi:predicted transcriptional regulator
MQSNYHSRLSDQDVEKIRLLLAEKRTQVEIATKFGVPQSVVSEINRGRKDKDNPKLVIHGISERTITLLQNIAENKGVDFKLMMRAHVIALLDQAPEHLKRTPRKDQGS